MTKPTSKHVSILVNTYFSISRFENKNNWKNFQKFISSIRLCYI